MVVGNTLSGNIFDFTQQNSFTIATRIPGTVYQNISGRTMYVVVTCQNQPAANAEIAAYTDNANPPITIVGYSSIFSAATLNFSLGFMVLPGNYYKVVDVLANLNALIAWAEYT